MRTRTKPIAAPDRVHMVCLILGLAFLLFPQAAIALGGIYFTIGAVGGAIMLFGWTAVEGLNFGMRKDFLGEFPLFCKAIRFMKMYWWLYMILGAALMLLATTILVKTMYTN